MITITGGQPYQQRRVRSMVRFCINSLMPRLGNKLDIRIQMSRTLTKRTGNLATCIWDDTNDRPRSFIIEADSTMNLRTLMISIAHEMVHVKQFARNEYKHMLMCSHRVKWMGKTVDINKVDYWELPWEIEAHGRETGLFINWCRHVGVEDKPWVVDKNEL